MYGYEEFRIKSPSEAPKTCHSALLIFETSSVFIEGDERSRTCPGHGYPARTETYDTFSYYAFLPKDESKLKEAVEKLYKTNPGRRDVLVLKVDGKMDVSMSVSFSLK